MPTDPPLDASPYWDSHGKGVAISIGVLDFRIPLPDAWEFHRRWVRALRLAAEFDTKPKEK